jgi:hypothetical protein
MLMLCMTGLPMFGQVIINSPTTFWTPILPASTNQADYYNDQQTGHPEADIVGNAAHPAAYFQFWNGGTPDPTDGVLGFRVRVGSDRPTPGVFNSVLFIGVDGNGDGALDIFLGVDNSGASAHIKIWDAGSGLNISPNTTTVNSPPGQKVYPQNATNYHFGPVSLTLDPPATDFDLDDDGYTDWFVSFLLPFADVVSEMSRLAGLSINESSLLRFVIATSTQQNALNQDLNGIPKNYNGNLTWEQLGGMNAYVTMIPEPGPGRFAILGALALAWAERSRRRPGGAPVTGPPAGGGERWRAPDPLRQHRPPRAS